MKHPLRTHNEGIALLTATIFMLVAVLLLSALSLRVINQNRQVDQYVRFSDCYQGLEAALAQAQADIEFGGDGAIGLGSWVPPSPSEGIALPGFDDESVSPLQIPSMPRVQYMAYSQNWATDGIDNNGDGSVDGIDENWIYTIYGFAQHSGTMERTVEEIIEGGDVNVWRNAIFGGTGQAGGLINGNVSIHGSVHLLGDDIPEGGVAVTAIDLIGASLIHNNYVGMPADLAARIPSLPSTLFNGEMVETLEAKLRVRNGLVGMSGNSEIGEPDVAGNSVKETMDGTFVNDGWTGNSVIDDGDRGDPTSVFSDNGWDMPYDLGDRVPLPVFADDWRDMFTGDRVVNSSTGAFYTHDEYFTELAGTPIVGDVLIEADVDYYYNATRPGDPDPANRLPTDDFLYFDATSNVMEINGQIEIQGNLEITRGGGNDGTINYTGRAAILVKGDVILDTDLLAVNSDGSTANSFPVNNVIGIMAENNMVVGSLAQLQLMGAFYAQNQLRSEKQTIILGTFVSNYFDMGTNVPDIFQVPELADNLPYGMIGAYPILVFSRVSWREFGV